MAGLDRCHIRAFEAVALLAQTIEVTTRINFRNALRSDPVPRQFLRRCSGNEVNNNKQTLSPSSVALRYVRGPRLARTKGG